MSNHVVGNLFRTAISGLICMSAISIMRSGDFLES